MAADDSLPKIKRIRCISPTIGIRCRWGTPTGQYCRRKTYANRTPRMIEVIDSAGKIGTICELYGIKCKTDPRHFKKMLREP